MRPSSSFEQCFSNQRPTKPCDFRDMNQGPSRGTRVSRTRFHQPLASLPCRKFIEVLYTQHPNPLYRLLGEQSYTLAWSHFGARRPPSLSRLPFLPRRQHLLTPPRRLVFKCPDSLFPGSSRSGLAGSCSLISAHPLHTTSQPHPVPPDPLSQYQALVFRALHIYKPPIQDALTHPPLAPIIPG